MMTDNEILTQLNWQTLACRCEITHHCAHRDKPCPNPADRRVEFHAVDHCNHTCGETNAFGNYVFLLCQQCLDMLVMDVQAHLWRLNRFGRAHCLSCGAPVRQVAHVIRGIEAI